MAQLLYQGHASLRITSDAGTVIYVDPFAGDGYDKAADLILITHDHPDHTGALDRVARADDCTEWHACDLHPDADTFETRGFRDVRVSAVQAGFNENHSVDDCAGYVIEVDGVQIYAAGDTDMTDDMREGKLEALGLDYALLPMDGFYNMDAATASLCAKAIGAARTIPIHTHPVHSPEDVCLLNHEVANAFSAAHKLIVEPGQEIELTKGNL